MIDDIRAIRKNDPSAKNIVEILLAYPTLHAILLHRLAHFLHVKLRIPILPRIIATLGRFWSGIEIHPGAQIGRSFFIDHGTGTVIGETAEIGENCVLFHGVTLGGTGHYLDKRHPTVGINVLIGAYSTLLGPIQVGDNVKIGANTTIINRDVPSNCTVAGCPGHIVRRDGKHTHDPLPQAHYKHQSQKEKIKNSFFYHC
ncbi:serine acetyltransferase [bacterium]|nr:serine acetyltransferase [bacterium]